MAHDWLDKPRSREHIVEQLQKLGIPLETRVSRICRAHRLLREVTSVGFSTFTTGRLLYNAGTSDAVLREVDQVLSAYGRFDLSEAVWLNTLVEVVIECKHRDGMAVFVFPEERENRFFPRPPIASEFSFSSGLQNLLKEHPYLPKSTIGLTGILTNFPDKSKPSEENFVYKATASLYDYIQSVVSASFIDAPDPLVEELGLADQIDLLANNSLFDVWQAASIWSAACAKEDTYQPAIAALPDRELEALVAIFLPVICIDAPIYDVEVEEDGAIGDITPIPYARTTARIPSWPGVNEQLFVRPQREAVVTIVSVDHLSELLDEIAAWVGKIMHGVSVVDDAQQLFQMLLMRSVRERFRHQQTTGFWHG